MTDDLDQDLRSLLAAKATAVTPDVSAGEQAIAERLRAGDHALADVVPLAPPRHRGRWLLAAAAAAVVALVAGALVLRDDGGVTTGPVASSTTGAPTPAVSFELAPVLASGPCDAVGADGVHSRRSAECYLLGDRTLANGFVDDAVVVEASLIDEISYTVQLTLTDDGIAALNALAGRCYSRDATCPTGQLAMLVGGQVQSAPVIQQPSFESDQIQISSLASRDDADRIAASLISPVASEPTTTTTSDSGAGNPLTATGGESVKDVAERVARLVFGEEYVTTKVENGDDRLLGGQSKVVTMEGTSSGDTLVAYLSEASPDGPLRVNVLTNPALDGHLTTNTTDGALTAVDLPADGSLTMWGFDGSLDRAGELQATPVANHRAEVDAPWWADAKFAAYELTTTDGAVRRAFLPVSTG